MIAKSQFGAVEVLDNAVVIKRKGAGEKRVPFDRIQGVEFKRGGLLSGYLRLDTGGGGSTGRKVRNKNEEILRDANSVLFNFNKNDDFQKVADLINERLNEN